MIKFHAPMVLAAISAVGMVSQANAQRNAATGQAQDARVQAQLEGVSLKRNLRDEQMNNQREIARARARLSAGGGDIGTILGMTARQHEESLIRQKRLKTDSQVRQATLRARAGNVAASGKTTQQASLLGAGGTFLGGMGGS